MNEPPGLTGVFFRDQSVESLVNAIRGFETIESRLDPEFIRKQVERFDVSRFKAEMSEFVAEKLREFRERVVREEPVPIHFSSQNPNAT